MLFPVNEDFINKELCKLNPSKSTGTDNISARIVKSSKNLFGVSLTFHLRKILFQKIKKNPGSSLCLRK